ncbi:N-acetylmuramoyl-L-alanine amidase [Streptantibioticus silvisoli]|uniref:N-acetylmuramoyl-L-alanine amidase n=1 Tax=Streptantibioticus silvisoli TaxID=2705255 RepID=A0ABT6VSX3_9ACTN|nr:N-acetylmuramoyl-L-alanine amidase [Streptantibioticus silvisoli]MDI5961573.1 N-acetylmuramoyl-L-alanine amidase [Streptantibioticus silvisoli]
MTAPFRLRVRGAAAGLLLCALPAAGCAAHPATTPAGTDPAARHGGSATMSAASGRPATASGAATPTAPASAGASAAKPLAGKVVVLDPGHNIDNQFHTAAIGRSVDIGNGHTDCDTTGTETDAGYPEASFTLDVSRRAAALLRALGATVKLTRDHGPAYGPCVNERARIGNEAHADAAVSVHADGAGADDRGFSVILPATVHQGIADTRRITGPSRVLGTDLRDRFAHDTGTSYSDYVGHGSGLDVRGDLGGLNLSTVPKVFIECGNMRNARDAALLTDAAWRQRAARGVADGISAYLEGAGR